MTNHCPCGARKTYAMVVCNACWDSSPDRLRRTWRCGSDDDQQKRHIALLNHAVSRAPKSPQLKPHEQLPLL